MRSSLKDFFGLFFFLVFWFLPLMAIGLILGSWTGGGLSLGFGTLVILIGVLISDKVFLGMLDGVPFKDKMNISQLMSNFNFKTQGRKIELYKSSLVMGGPYLIDSFLFGPSMILGKNVLNDLSEKEIKALCLSCAIRLRSGRYRFITLFSFMLNFYLLPIYLLTSGSRLSFLRRGLLFLVFPLGYLSKSTFFREEKIRAFNDKFRESTHLENEYKGVIGKLSYFEGPLSTKEIIILSLSQNLNFLEKSGYSGVESLIFSPFRLGEKA